MMLAGVSVPERLVLELVGLLSDSGFVDTAELLEHAHDSDRRIVALTVPSREAILRALESCPDGLAELRSVLLKEHVWRKREGLV